MSLASHFDEWSVPTAWAATLLTVLLGWQVWRVWREMPRIAGEAGPRAVPSAAGWSLPAVVQVRDWSAFHAPGTAPAGTGALARRFRLAGTFMGEGPGPGSRKAVLEDSKGGRQQRIVGEGEAIDEVTVVSVQSDRVLLRAGSEEQELRLGMSAGARASQGAGGATNALAAGGDLPGDGWLGRKQLGENRWVFSRQKVIDYYSELRNEPQRLVAVFDSLRPLYNERRQITGYQLNVAGEADFFSAVGLKEGDVVRSVNSMQMTSRKRAEYMIHEFVNDRSNVFVMDVERGGSPQRLVYEAK